MLPPRSIVAMHPQRGAGRPTPRSYPYRRTPMSKWTIPASIGLLAATIAGAASAQIMLYEHDNFNGRTYRASNSVSNLGETGFNDRASSAQVRGGRWQL